jgi:ABC-type sugar transport system permease subunit
MCAYPLFELGRMSVSDVGGTNLLGDWPFVGAANFQEMIEVGRFQTALANTLIFVAVVLGVSLVGGFVAALVLLPRTGINRFTETLVVFIWAIPPIVTGTLWKFVLDGRGPANAVMAGLGVAEPVSPLIDGPLPLLSVSLVTAWVSIPFAFLVFRAALLDLSIEVLEAAEMDGASRAQLLRFVIIPLVRPTAMILAVLIVVYGFRSFDFIYVMTSGGPGLASTTIPYLSYVTTFSGFNFDVGAAISAAALILVLVVAGLYVRAVRTEVSL